jgi:hypothetical protein
MAINLGRVVENFDANFDRSSPLPWIDRKISASRSQRLTPRTWTGKEHRIADYLSCILFLLRREIVVSLHR